MSRIPYNTNPTLYFHPSNTLNASRNPNTSLLLGQQQPLFHRTHDQSRVSLSRTSLDRRPHYAPKGRYQRNPNHMATSRNISFDRPTPQWRRLSDSKHSHPSMQSTVVDVGASKASELMMNSYASYEISGRSRRISQGSSLDQPSFSLCESRQLPLPSANYIKQMPSPKATHCPQAREIFSQLVTPIQQFKRNKIIDQPIDIQGLSSQPPNTQLTVCPPRAAQVQHRREVIEEKEEKVIALVLYPNMALHIEIPKSVISNKKIQVLGSYHSNDKSESFTLREFPKLKNQPITMKVIGITPLDNIPTEVFKIALGKLNATEFNSDSQSLRGSRRSFSVDSKTQRFSGNVKISVYRSPDVIIFSPQFAKGVKISKKHIQRIAVEGRLVVNDTFAILPCLSSVPIPIIPLESLGKLLSLNFSRELGICQNSASADLEKLSEENQTQEKIEVSSVTETVTHEQSQIILTESVTASAHKHTDNPEQLQQPRRSSKVKLTQQCQDTYSITSLLSELKSCQSSSFDHNYTKVDIPDEILEDLKRLKEKTGSHLAQSCWFKLNRPGHV